MPAAPKHTYPTQIGDGGRSKYRRGRANDCVVRALACYTQQDYKQLERQVVEEMNTRYQYQHYHNAQSGVPERDAVTIFTQIFGLQQLRFAGKAQARRCTIKAPNGKDINHNGDMASLPYLPAAPMLVDVRRPRTTNTHITFWDGTSFVDMSDQKIYTEIIAVYYDKKKYGNQIANWITDIREHNQKQAKVQQQAKESKSAKRREEYQAANSHLRSLPAKERQHHLLTLRTSYLIAGQLIRDVRFGEHGKYLAEDFWCYLQRGIKAAKTLKGSKAPIAIHAEASNKLVNLEYLRDDNQWIKTRWL